MLISYVSPCNSFTKHFEHTLNTLTCQNPEKNNSGVEFYEIKPWLIKRNFDVLVITDVVTFCNVIS